MSLSPQERILRARAGAYAQHAKHDTHATTQAGRDAFLQRFYDATPADLPEAERMRRAIAARRSHMTVLALKSARARARKAS